MKKICFINKENTFFTITILLVLGMLTCKLLNSSLWYDEAIEYWVSKMAIGAAPGMRATSNIYERIIQTYQPPLYNALMHLWLSLFDSEFAFRFAGVLMTTIGAIGFYLTINSTIDYKWASLATLIYSSVWGVSYYAQECAEYNLMLAMLTWTIFFWVKGLRQFSVKSLIGFMFFASLSVYSQYGAAFVVLPMALIFAIDVLRLKNKKAIRVLFIVFGIVVVAAIIPLLIFFFIPQFTRISETATSLSPEFANNIFYDFAKSVFFTIGFQFSQHGGSGLLSISNIFRYFVLLICLFCCLIALFRKGNFIYRKAVVATAISYLFYYLAVKFRFYAASYMGEFGNRWSLMLLPLLLLVFVLGFFFSREYVKLKFDGRKENWNAAVTVILVTISVVLIGSNFSVIWKNWEKDQTRNVTKIWYESNCYEYPTIVHEWADPTFQFYLTHLDAYQEELQENIINTDRAIRSFNKNEMFMMLDGKFKSEWPLELYYIGPDNDSLQIVKNTLIDEGYDLNFLYRREEMRGTCTLIYAVNESMKGEKE